jgi:hypothetical protein
MIHEVVIIESDIICTITIYVATAWYFTLETVLQTLQEHLDTQPKKLAK